MAAAEGGGGTELTDDADDSPRKASDEVVYGSGQSAPAREYGQDGPALVSLAGGRSRALRDEEEPTYDGKRKDEPYVKAPVDALFAEGLSDAAFRVYCALIHHDGGRGCFPARSTLAKRLGRSVVSVARALAELEAAGLIERTMPVPGGVTHYHLPRIKNDTGGYQKRDPPRIKSETPPVSNLTHRTRTTEPEPKNHPPLPPQGNGAVPSRLEGLLGENFKDVSADFTALHDRLTAQWLRRTLAEAEAVAPGIDRPGLVKGLGLGIRDLEGALRTTAPTHPQAYAGAIVVKAIGEAAS